MQEIGLSANREILVKIHGLKSLNKIKVTSRSTRGVDPYGTGGTRPPNIIYEGGTSMVMSPNILEMMSFRLSTRVTTRNYVHIQRKVDDVGLFVVF